MKTLDEVIAELEDARVQVETGTGYWVDYRDNDELKTDALHYLQAFRDAKDTLEREKDRYAEAVRNCDKAEAKYTMLCMEYARNDPLDWEDLKQMEGKPVWVEAESLSVGVSPYWKDWYIIKSFSNDEFMYCNDGFEWAKEMQGRLWQAYRKERA